MLKPANNLLVAGGKPRFLTTAWTVVLSAAQEGAPGANDSLAELCRTYWQPIHAFILHQPHPPHDAEDLTQEFFAELLADRTLHRAERARGRFRSFLLGALRRFLADQAVRRQARKRGSGCEFVPLHTLTGSEVPAAGGPSAQDFFEARWARALLDATVRSLREEWAGEGKGDHFDILRRFLPGGGAATGSHHEAATRLGISDAALKSLLHRLRIRYRDLLRRQVARTVAAPHEIDDEIRHLCVAAALLEDGAPP